MSTFLENIPYELFSYIGGGIFLFIILYKFFPNLFVKIHKPILVIYRSTNKYQKQKCEMVILTTRLWKFEFSRWKNSKTDKTTVAPLSSDLSCGTASR